MARQTPQKDPQAADLVQRAKEARARLPGIVQQIEDLVRRVDPIELLSQLTLLFQTHPANQQPNRDESALWQARLEWLTWLVFARGLSTPPHPEAIDARILDPLDKLLDEYVFTATMTLPEPVEGLTEDQNEVRSLIQLEAMHVRGEAFQAQLECKWKSLTLVARSGDVTDVFLVTLVGTGAWALIAANLVRLAPLGLLADGEYPWALSLNDLRVVADCLELPSQLFDYLRRRYEAQREPRFRFHDEWDLLGVYLAGALDINDPRFEDMDFVALDGFDSDLQDY